MAKSQESWNKKEKEKQKQKNKKEKELKKQERRARSKDGSGLDDMIAYVDENGVITSTPPDPTKKKVEINLEDIAISVRKKEDAPPMDIIRKGKVAFFNDSKGYGFIKDNETQESVFVHANSLSSPIKENDKVTFEVEMGPKGPMAVRVSII